jgi:hypothetical protein
MNIQEEIEDKIKTEFRSEDFETPEDEAQRIKDEDIEPTEKDILKNQILSDLAIMKKDVDTGYYNFLNAAEYLKALNKILTKVSQLLGGYKYNTDPTDFNEPI